MRLLAVLSATALLIGGCGTPMYELTEDEETLITQYAAYAVGKHNIRQKDGMTGDKPQEEDPAKSEQQSTEDKTDPANQNPAQTGADSNETDADILQYPAISFSDALECDAALTVSYKGCKVEDAYKEGGYFSVNADPGNSLVVLKFVIVNNGKKSVKYDTSSMKNTFYGVFDGKNRIAEKMTFSNKELTSSTRTIKPGEKAAAVMLFELSKEQAAEMTTETLLVEIDGTTYRVDMQK